MAVLLEGINIPEGNPITINIYRDGTWVNAYTTEDGNATEVPEPHGRLIDADALMLLRNMTRPNCEFVGDRLMIDVNMIDDAPTVISASEEG